MMQWMFTDNYDSSFCFWVFEKRLTQKNCFLFCKKYGLFNSSIFFNNQQIFTVLLSKLSWSAFRGDKILVFHTRSRVVSPTVDPDRVTRFQELSKNSQIWMKMDKNLIFCEVFQTRNQANILSRSAIVSHGEGSFKEPVHKQFYSKWVVKFQANGS